MNQQQNQNRPPRKKRAKKVFDPKSKADPLASLFSPKPKTGVSPEPRRPQHQDQRQSRPPALKKVPALDSKIRVHGIDPFTLFCGYHLGITKDDVYRPQNINDVSRQFNVKPAQVNEALKAYGLDAESVMNTDFDMSMAQLDIKVAPPGVSKIELAKNLYEEFRDAPKIIRDWLDEIEKDAAENDKIFQKLK